MDFSSTESFIKTKIKELELPYFKIVVKKNGEEVFCFRHSIYDGDNDLLAMYSMTKVVTAVAMMQLIEKKLVNEDDLVSKYLKGYDNLKLTNGEKVKTPLKIKHLLTMTGGFDYNFDRASIKSKITSNPKASTSEICESFALDGLLWEPGTKFNYSFSIDIIGGIIEKVSGVPFDKYVEENIFKPLNMKKSTLNPDEKTIESTVVDVLENDGKLINTAKYLYLIKLAENYSSGGSSLISTVDEFANFTSALLNEKLISKESIKMMATSYNEETPFCKEVQTYSVASFDYGYGFGVRVRKNPSPHGMPIGEFGWDGAAGSYCLCDPINNITIVMGMNVQCWPTYIKDLHVKIVEHVYDDIMNNLR